MSFINNPKHIPESYGLRIAAGLILFFVLMQVIGLAHIVELRLLNLLVLAVGIYFGLKKFKETHQHRIHYFRALAVGVATGGIASLAFALFMFLYMKADHSFMQWIIDNEPMGRYLNAYIVAFIVALEGVFSSLLVTFVLINYIETEGVEQ
ncbi:MAG: DUF4199 domain-containing protein [Bacteroidetes bacterium]|nr:DUF4199 domain-containing protein [Bacteroidota bacterium]